MIMNALNPLKKMRPPRDRRSGVTIIEVLTSILIAVIGVAGVLVLIPFGIRQAQTGLDLREATAVAENAAQEFQMRGYAQLRTIGGKRVLPWIGLDRELIRNNLEASLTYVALAHDPSPPPPSSNFPVGWYFIDPLWLSTLANPATGYPSIETLEQMFRFVGTDPSDEAAFLSGIPADGLPPAFPRYVHLLDPIPSVPTIAPISLGVAARMFQSRDDLQFAVETDPITGAEISEFSPPRPYLDLDAGGVPMRRQFQGDITWSAVAVPKRKVSEVNLLGNQGLRTEGFDFHVLVFKNRSLQNPAGPIPNQDEDPRFLYTTLSSTPNANPNQIFSTAAITLDVAPGAINIRSGSWVMLINYDLNRQAQVGFYRVLGSVPDEQLITIDGSDFTINDELPDGSANRSKTFVIFFPEVVSVFKKQLILESESTF